MDQEQIIKDIEDFMRSGMACAPSTLIGICKNMDRELDEDKLLLLASGFGHGIGGYQENGTCAGITATALALGLIEKDAGKVKEISRLIFENFKGEFKTTECNRLTDYGKDKTHCIGYCAYGVKLLDELIDE